MHICLLSQIWGTRSHVSLLKPTKSLLSSEHTDERSARKIHRDVERVGVAVPVFLFLYFPVDVAVRVAVSVQSVRPAEATAALVAVLVCFAGHRRDFKSKFKSPRCAGGLNHVR